MAKHLVTPVSDQNAETEKKEPGRIEFNFPLLTIRTKMFGGVFDRLGALSPSRFLGSIALIIVPIVAAIGVYFFCVTLTMLLCTPGAADAVGDLGPETILLLPGINPILPVVYGWLGIVCAIVVHEGAHGVIARNRGLTVKSSGLLFFLIIPIGAFVDVDEDQISKAKASDSLRVMAAGVAGNIIVALVCLLAVLLIVNGLTPLINGVYVSAVVEGMPAEASGLLPEDVFVSINDIPIANYDELGAFLNTTSPGDTIQVKVARGTDWKERYSTALTLAESTEENKTGKAAMGVFVGELGTEELISFYGTPRLGTLELYMLPPSLSPGWVPFSDSYIQFYTHGLGDQWHVYANVFYWLWFINVNVAVFNALPIYPLDGGRMFNITLKRFLGKKLSEKTITRITAAVTVAMIGILAMIILISYVI